ncbi:MAG TPA: hypothetical protein VMW65_04615 [Chloroflexota bacterium]|nr:hypothetical protein [Chloroflexota bacterium]
MEFLSYWGTDDGVLVMRRLAGNWEERAVGLKGKRVTALAHQPGHPEVIFAGSYGSGLFFSADAGSSWRTRNEGLTFTHVRSILFDPANLSRILVGTEPAAVFRSVDLGQNWEELTALRGLPCHEKWFLPYSPRAGAVRSLAAVPGQPGSFYAGIEQGGVAFTYDDGNTWRMLDRGVDEDVHQVLVAVDGGSTIFAATGGGVYRSFDGGQSWDRVLTDYTRALAQQPGHLTVEFAAPALQVGHQGRIERSVDDGSTWQPWTAGLDIPLSGIVDQFLVGSGSLNELGGIFAVLSDGEIWHSNLDRPSWVPVVCGGTPHVNVVEIAVG